MTTPTFPTGLTPALRDEKKKTFRTKSTQFGDGYSENSQDGINNIIKSGSLNFVGLTTTEKETLETFLDARAGFEPFNITLPGESTPTLILVNSYNCQTIGGSYWSASFSYRQYFQATT
jgi:phage-related protein